MSSLHCCPAVDCVPVFNTFKTIKLGTGPRTAYDFRKFLEDNGISIDDCANDLFNYLASTVATQESELDLVIANPSDLGFASGATRKQINARAKEYGLDLCPAEVGPQLRVQYKDQPIGELFIAMEPAEGAVGYLSLFKVKRSASALSLSCYSASPACVWSLGARFVFSRRK